MFHRMVDSRNRHFSREAELEKQVAAFLKEKGKELPAVAEAPRDMNAKVWAASIILIIPSIILVYYLSRDLIAHEKHEDVFLAAALPERMFMPQTYR